MLFRSGDAVTRQLQQVIVERVMHEILDYAARADDDNPDGFGGLIAGVAVVSAAEAGEIRAKWKELLAPYLLRAVGSGRRLPPDQRHVRYFMAGTPLPDLDEPKDNINDAHD